MMRTKTLPTAPGAIRLFLCWLTCLAHAPATTVSPPDFGHLVARAETIFTGKALSSRSEWMGQGNQRCIVTFVTFEVQAVHKGNATARLELRFLGGTIGDTALEVYGVPRFTIGERVILFVEKNGEQFCPLVGICHGRLAIERDPATGQDILLRHNRRPLVNVREIGSGEELEAKAATAQPTAGRPLTIAEFIGQIQQELARTQAR